MRTPAALLIPGTPLLLEGIDACEPADVRDLRTAMGEVLRSAPEWTVVLPGNAPNPHGGTAAAARSRAVPGARPEAETLPQLLSLGGLGVPRGVRVSWRDARAAAARREAHLASSGSLEGPALVSAVGTLRELDPASAAASENVPTGIVVAVLAALDAGVRVRLVSDPRVSAAEGLSAQEGQSEVAGPSRSLLVPLDFSGAAHPDAPLAPIGGAEAFDEALEQVLTGQVDRRALAHLHPRAEAAAAWTAALRSAFAGSALGESAPGGTALRGTLLAAADSHHVRYRLIQLDGHSGPHADGGGI
ncbi:hypothetical protein [Brevibacterium album]|uniref:hypothetical protein n=1 Tax=Brevibacterium album TaxID=417948 RepID=UPI00040E969A|nr:hypothetical protein [Brevibacterium album]